MNFKEGVHMRYKYCDVNITETIYSITELWYHMFVSCCLIIKWYQFKSMCFNGHQCSLTNKVEISDLYPHWITEERRMPVEGRSELYIRQTTRKTDLYYLHSRTSLRIQAQVNPKLCYKKNNKYEEGSSARHVEEHTTHMFYRSMIQCVCTLTP